MTPPPASAEQAVPALLAELARRGISDVAFTGAIAYGAWAVPRTTKDFDLCAAVPEAAVDPLLARYDGIRVGPERIPSTIRFEFAGWQVDVFVARTAYDLECLRRAVSVELLGTAMKIVTAEDLLLHKLIKVRDEKSRLLQDAADIRTLVSLRAESLDWAYIERWSDGEKVTLLRSAALMDEAELVGRLKAL